MLDVHKLGHRVNTSIISAYYAINQRASHRRVYESGVWSLLFFKYLVIINFMLGSLTNLHDMLDVHKLGHSVKTSILVSGYQSASLATVDLRVRRLEPTII